MKGLLSLFASPCPVQIARLGGRNKQAIRVPAPNWHRLAGQLVGVGRR
jgi:hypothetical protein